MRLKFFAAHTVVQTPKAEELIVAKDVDASSCSSFSESEDCSTFGSNDHSFEQITYEDDGATLPEFDSILAAELKHLLLSPLEPDMEF